MINNVYTLSSLKHTPHVIVIGTAALGLVWLITWSWMRWEKG